MDHKITLILDQKTFNRMSEVQELVGLDSKLELIKCALAVYDTLAHRSNSNQIVIKEGDTEYNFTLVPLE